ncbi:NAD-dependent dehydratase [Saccharobesus litoralis]|uniref:NAD-dependent dehydratase n=1 Tax=Saccharobesus litoralis TaxID=2172099 RepID=A0A2S0VU84_9ALTE|nr:NAD-dependent epimerase/dehydratase family protein [Saccharobesus litoralis]AWB67769.1 NAD-dependent dehydratase [Saccharobesus litoralis]
MELKNKRLLVIGGAGFIGSHIVKELLKTSVQEIIIYDNFTRGKKEFIEESLKDPRCNIYPNGGDIRDIDILNDAMQGIDGVFHLAAMWLLHCNDFPRTAFEVNVQGTFNVLEACVKNNIQKLVFSSSASVYGDAVEVPMTENHPFNNKNFYGASKISGEALCRATSDRFGLDYVGLRYMNVYGPNQAQTGAYTGVIPIMLNKIEANEQIIINGDGTQAYDFIHVSDVAKCNILAMQAKTKDEFYNVGTGKQTKIKDLCQLILKLKESNSDVCYQPYSDNDSRRLVQNRIGCGEKALHDLGFKYQIQLEEGLQQLIEWRDKD